MADKLVQIVKFINKVFVFVTGLVIIIQIIIPTKTICIVKPTKEVQIRA